jgi:hypothetical protein
MSMKYSVYIAKKNVNLLKFLLLRSQIDLRNFSIFSLLLYACIVASVYNLFYIYSDDNLKLFFFLVGQICFPNSHYLFSLSLFLMTMTT